MTNRSSLSAADLITAVTMLEHLVAAAAEVPEAAGLEARRGPRTATDDDCSPLDQALDLVSMAASALPAPSVRGRVTRVQPQA